MLGSNRVSLKRKAPKPEDGPSTASVCKLDEDWVVVEKDPTSHHGTLFGKIQKFKHCNEFTDFTIKVGGKNIPVHKMLLAASSEYFERMLSCGLEETKQGVMHIKEVDLRAVEICIDFIYTGKASFPHSEEFAEKLIHASELFQLTELTDKYFEILQKKVSVENCLLYIFLAERYSKQLLADFFQNFFWKNFDEVIRCDVFLNLEKDLLEDFLSNVRRSDAGLEILVWEGIKSWIDKNDEDKEHISDLCVKYVSFDQLPFHRLQEISIETKGKQSQELKDKFLEAYSSVDNQADSPGFVKDATHILVCKAKTRGVYGMNVATRKWTRYASVPQNLCLDGVQLVNFKSRVYLTTANSVYRLQHGEFSYLCKFHNVGRPIPTTFAGVFGSSQSVHSIYQKSIVHREFIYIITHHQIVKISTRTHKYTSVAVDLPLGDLFFVTASNTHVYAMAQGQNKAYRMSFSDEVWEPFPGISNSTTLSVIFWHNSKLHCIRKFIYCYDPDANTWSRDRNYQAIGADCKVLTVEDDIYLIGGQYGISKLQGGSVTALATTDRLYHGLACAVVT